MPVSFSPFLPFWAFENTAGNGDIFFTKKPFCAFLHLTHRLFFSKIHQEMEEKVSSISLANVSASYDNGADVLTDVSFNIAGGTIYFLTGASGAGKTTLLRLIYQLHKPDTGQIKIFGKVTNDMSRDEITALRKKMAIVFQGYSLLSHLSVFDNVALPLRVRGMSETKIHTLVPKVLDWVGLAKYADANPLILSGGQQQRVSVARAIIIQPAILLADEPTGNLDDENASRLMDLFIQMNKMFGTTIILATHNKQLIETYKFPVLHVENHHVKFVTQKNSTMTENKKLWKGPAPKNYFNELSKQFDDIGKI